MLNINIFYIYVHGTNCILCLNLQLQQTEDLKEFRELVNSRCDLIFDSGYQKPLAISTLANKNEIIRAIFLQQTVYSCLAELDQMKSGLNILGVIDEISESPDMLLDYFTAVNRIKLTAGQHFTYTNVLTNLCMLIYIRRLCTGFI